MNTAAATSRASRFRLDRSRPAQVLPARLVAISLLCLAVSAARAQFADDPENPPQFRAFWADAFNAGFKNQTQINSLISRAVAGRYNAIIIEVLAFHDTGANGHGAYWNSAIVPKASDIIGGIDPLAQLVSAAHANNLEVHAWIVPFRVCSTWPPPGNSYLAARPHWLMVPQAASGGGPATVGSHYTFDPGSPDVQEYLVSIVRELCTNYAIDGINLDYIRYVQTDAGYPADASYQQSSLARFRRLTGYVGTPPPTGNTSWNNFRRQGIDELVRRLRAEIPAVTSNPRQPLRLTADLIVFGNAPALFTNSDAYNLFQNWRMWMERGWLDAGIPMNYKREHVSTEATWYRNWVVAAIGWRYQRHMFMGQGNYLNTKANSVTQLAYSLNAGCDGAVNYSYYSTADENINGTPENDWTWYTYVSTNLYTQTAPTPTMPWRDPNLATEGTLWGRVIDASTNQPVDGALVQALGFPAVATDANGYYVVTLLPAGIEGGLYSVTASNGTCDPVTLNNVPVLRGRLTRQDFALCSPPEPPPFGDLDGDNDVDMDDFEIMVFCMQGPDITYIPGEFCLLGDSDDDFDVDLRDFAALQPNFDP